MSSRRSVFVGQVEEEAAVEPTRPQQGGVERVAAVGGRDQQDVVVATTCRALHLPVGWAGSR